MTYGNSAMHRHGPRFLMFMHEEAVSRLCLITILGALVILFLSRIQQAHAEPETANEKASLAMLQPGEVTANQGENILIDNKRYSMLPSAIVRDDEGRPRDLKEFVPGMQVRFHLRNDKIDQLVMMLPR